jgi:DNA-binding LytR/AlgR family response regulator
VIAETLMSGPKAVIAEDEPVLRAQLRDALSVVWPDLTVSAEAADGVQALDAVATHAPDVVFLDIEMPGMSGLEVAQKVGGRCHVVFVTAYDRYAVDAFEQGAVDYVMKPFSAERIAKTMSRLKPKLASVPANLDGIIAALAARLEVRKEYLRWITVTQGQNLKVITVNEICYIQADNKYTLIATASSQSLVRTPIKELIDELDPEVFWQIHRSTLVNVNAIDSVTRSLRGKLQVRLKARKEALPVSDTYAYRFKHL